MGIYCMAVNAHQVNPNQPKDASVFGMAKPVVIHSLRCAMTILHETQLPDEIGCRDIRHCCCMMFWKIPVVIPGNLDERVVVLVHGMTFDSFQAEQAAIWDQPDDIKLLKLYDKTSILMDAVWMRDKKWNNLVDYTLALADFVEKTYGLLNVVNIARALARRRSSTAYRTVRKLLVNHCDTTPKCHCDGAGMGSACFYTDKYPLAIYHTVHTLGW